MPAGQFLASDANCRETRRFRPDADMRAVPGRRAFATPARVLVGVARLDTLPDGESRFRARPSALAACPHAGPVPASPSSTPVAGTIVVRDGGLDVAIVRSPLEGSRSSSFCIRSERL